LLEHGEYFKTKTTKEYKKYPIKLSLKKIESEETKNKNNSEKKSDQTT